MTRRAPGQCASHRNKRPRRQAGTARTADRAGSLAGPPPLPTPRTALAAPATPDAGVPAPPSLHVPCNAAVTPAHQRCGRREAGAKRRTSAQARSADGLARSAALAVRPAVTHGGRPSTTGANLHFWVPRSEPQALPSPVANAIVIPSSVQGSNVEPPACGPECDVVSALHVRERRSGDGLLRVRLSARPPVTWIGSVDGIV